MNPDDAEYRKSVRNTSVVLIAVILTVIVAIAIYPRLNQTQERFQKSASVGSSYGYGFTFNAAINATQVTEKDHLNITIWMNTTSFQTQNITAMNQWTVQRANLWSSPCISANDWWPIGVGVMSGYYTDANLSEGVMVQSHQRLLGCLPVSGSNNGTGTFQGPARYFILQRYSWNSIVVLKDGIESWQLRTSLLFGKDTLIPIETYHGTFTVVAADEWGDYLTLHFRVT